MNSLWRDVKPFVILCLSDCKPIPLPTVMGTFISPHHFVWNFQVTIRAADGDGLATTSVILWDGPDNELQDHNWQDEPDWTSSDGICVCCYNISIPDV